MSDLKEVSPTRSLIAMLKYVLISLIVIVKEELGSLMKTAINGQEVITPKLYTVNRVVIHLRDVITPR